MSVDLVRRVRIAAVVLGAATLLVVPISGSLAGGAPDGPPTRDDTRSVMFVGNNHAGTADIIDAETHERLKRIDIVPDREERMAEIRSDPERLVFFIAIREFIGMGNDQLVDDMFTSHDGTMVYASRPSYADVVGISLETEEIVWRFEIDGQRSDHMAISPDGETLLVSDSTANVVHELDADTGQRTGQFPSGDSPHENEYFADGDRIVHAAIGRVYTPTDRSALGPIRDISKGEEFLQVVDADSLEVLKRWDINEKLDEFGEEDMSGAVRPMALSPDEQTLYFQVSFHHGFVEFDLSEGEVTDVIDLPLTEESEDIPREQYVLDSAHHGLAMNPEGDKLCAAGTMSDYAAIVERGGEYEETIASRGAKPYWSTTGPGGEHCWVSYSGDNEVAVIDYETEQEVSRIDVGDHPQRIRAGAIREDYLASPEPVDRSPGERGRSGSDEPDHRGGDRPPGATPDGAEASADDGDGLLDQLGLTSLLGG